MKNYAEKTIKAYIYWITSIHTRYQSRCIYQSLARTSRQGVTGC
ncbi:hypothetical protein [Psychromonas sp. SP041]